MGFWSGVGKLIAGKPVFETPKGEGHDDWDDDAPTVDYAEDREAKRSESQGLHDENGIKQIPVVNVERVKYIISGDYTEVWATIGNNSQRTIELDKITICGQNRELDYPLAPGANREFSVFKGRSLKHDSYTKAHLFYKDTQTGDYFRADHLVEYHYEPQPDEYYVNSLELIQPINDV